MATPISPSCASPAGNSVEESSTIGTPMEVGGGLIRSAPVMIPTSSSSSSAAAAGSASSSGVGVLTGGGGSELGLPGGILGGSTNFLGNPGGLLTTTSSMSSGVPSATSAAVAAALHEQHQHNLQQATTKKVELEIAPTTGGSFTFVIDPNESIEGLKKAIGKRLKVGKEHICLLHRDR